MNLRHLHSFILLLLPALLGSCGKQIPLPAPPAEMRVIPYRATVTEGYGTRAGLDGSQQHYLFESGDRLFLESGGSGSDRLYGVLSLSSGAGQTSAVFEGELHCSGDFEPSGSTLLSATLVGASDRIHSVSDGLITAVTYPGDGSAPDLSEAVRQFSHFTGSGTFGGKTFTLTQQSAFLILDITFDAGSLTDGDQVTLALDNGSGALRSLRVSPDITNGIAHTHLFLPFPGGEVTLSSATVSVDDGLTFSIPSEKTLAANTYYSVTRSTIPFVTLPPTSDYTAGSAGTPEQAFPVRVALRSDANIVTNTLADDSVLDLIITTPDDEDVTIPLTALDRTAGMDLDPEEVLDAILTQEGTTVLKTGDYTFSVNGAASTAATMTLLRSAYSPGGEGWWDPIPGGLKDGDYVEVKMNVNQDVTLANLISFGTVLGELGVNNDWSKVKGILIFYPQANNNYKLLIHGRNAGSDVFGGFQRDFNYSTGPWAGKALVIRFAYDDIYWNDGLLTKDGNTDKLNNNRSNFNEKYPAWFVDNELKVGSYQGTNRSKSYYDYIRVVRYPAGD